MGVGRLVSIGNWLLSGSMLIYQRVIPSPGVVSLQTTKQQRSFSTTAACKERYHAWSSHVQPNMLDPWRHGHPTEGGRRIPSGKRLHNYGKSPCSMGKSTISMVIFHSYVKLPEGTFFFKTNQTRYLE